MPKSIEVSLDVNNVPPVTVKPEDVEMLRGDDTIHWVRAKNQDFDFDSVEINDVPPGTFTPAPNHPGTIAVKDHNTRARDYPYVLTVSSGGKQYQSKKPGAHVGSGGSPTIHNR